MPRERDELKLDATLSFRIPTHTKLLFEVLTIEQKHEAYRKMRIQVARAIHDAQFKPEMYLGDGEDRGD